MFVNITYVTWCITYKGPDGDTCNNWFLAQVHTTVVAVSLKRI